MTNKIAAAINIDLDAYETRGSNAPSRAMVRGRDGRMRAVDVARLAWPDDRAAAGVDYMADLYRYGPIGRC